MFSHSLKAVYAIPNTIVSAAILFQLSMGDDEHLPAMIAKNNAPNAIKTSPAVQCMTAKVISRAVPVVQIVYSGSWRVSHRRFATAVTPR